MAISRTELNRAVSASLERRTTESGPSGGVAKGEGSRPLASLSRGEGSSGASGPSRVSVGDRPPGLMTAAQLVATAGKPSWVNRLPFRSPSAYKEIVGALDGFGKAGGAKAGVKLAKLDRLERAVQAWETKNAGRTHKGDNLKRQELATLKQQIVVERQSIGAQQDRGLLATMKDATPASLQLTRRDDDGVFAGDIQGRYPRSAVDSFVDDFDRRLTKATAEAPVPRADGSGDHPAVTHQFAVDIDRSDVRLQTTGGSVLLRSDNAENPRDTLHSFAGSDNKAFNLSRFLNQSTNNALHGGLAESTTTAEGAVLFPMFGSSAPDGAGKPQRMTVSKDPAGDFVVDYRMATSFDRFTDGVTHLPADQANSSAEMSFKIKLKADDLEHGRLAYEVLQPPSYQLHFELDEAAAREQARNR